MIPIALVSYCNNNKVAQKLIIQSRLGGEMSADEILSKIPNEVEKVYIKPEENGAYWVSSNDAGSVELW